MLLMMEHAFSLGYRRYEWKCDDLNARSRNAALRYGFRYEGTFRNAAVYKGRNRDTAWFSVIEDDWPSVRRAMLEWLDDGNFDRHGVQRRSLAELRSRGSGAAGPSGVRGGAPRLLHRGAKGGTAGDGRQG